MCAGQTGFAGCSQPLAAAPAAVPEWAGGTPVAVRHFWVATALCTVAELSLSKVKRSWDPECLFIATMYSCLGTEEAKKCSYFIFQWLGQAGQAALPP